MILKFNCRSIGESKGDWTIAQWLIEGTITTWARKPPTQPPDLAKLHHLGTLIEKDQKLNVNWRKSGFYYPKVHSTHAHCGRTASNLRRNNNRKYCEFEKETKRVAKVIAVPDLVQLHQPIATHPIQSYPTGGGGKIQTFANYMVIKYCNNQIRPVLFKNQSTTGVQIIVK